MKVYVIWVMLVAGVFAQTGAKVGMSFLKLGVDARAAAMANAYSSTTSDASAMYWNPAGLSLAGGRSVVLMHNVWLQDIYHEFAAAQMITGSHNIGIVLNWMRIPGIQLRGETASEQPDGETNVDYIALGIGYARKLPGEWHIGIQFKYLSERYYLEDARGYALDIGVIRALPLEGAKWGLSVQNIGKMGVVREKRTDLPLLVRTGLSYKLPWQLLDQQPFLALDYLYVADDVSQLGLGTEIGINENLTFRGGYLFGHESSDFTVGLGVNYSVYDFAYAFVPFQYDLGDSHRFSLRFMF